MKTPEAIARDASASIKNFPDVPSENDLRQAMIAAIEADRAQRSRPVVVVRESMAFGHDDEVDIVDLDFIGSWPDAHGDFDQDDIDRMLATLERGEFHSAADDLREWWADK